MNNTRVTLLTTWENVAMSDDLFLAGRARVSQRHVCRHTGMCDSAASCLTLHTSENLTQQCNIISRNMRAFSLSRWNIYKFPYRAYTQCSKWCSIVLYAQEIQKDPVYGTPKMGPITQHPNHHDHPPITGFAPALRRIVLSLERETRVLTLGRASWGPRVKRWRICLLSSLCVFVFYRFAGPIQTFSEDKKKRGQSSSASSYSRRITVVAVAGTYIYVSRNTSNCSEISKFVIHSNTFLPNITLQLSFLTLHADWMSLFWLTSPLTSWDFS